MSIIERPDSTDGMVSQLWFAIIGSNGDGMASRLRRVEDTIAELQKADMLYVATRKDTCPNVEPIEKIHKVLEVLEHKPEKTAYGILKYTLTAVGGGFLVLILSNGPSILKLLIGIN